MAFLRFGYVSLATLAVELGIDFTQIRHGH